jgi:hypothetical protein
MVSAQPGRARRGKERQVGRESERNLSSQQVVAQRIRLISVSRCLSYSLPFYNLLCLTLALLPALLPLHTPSPPCVTLQLALPLHCPSPPCATLQLAMTRLGEMMNTMGRITYQLNVSMQMLGTALSDFSKVQY